MLMDIAGVLLVAATAYLAWLGRSVPSWPQVRGTVTVSKAEEITGEDGHSYTVRKLRYTYEVSRKRYVGKRVRFGLGHGRWSQTWRPSRAYQAHAERLEEGQGVTVWHHPRWPRLCTLQPGGMPGAAVLAVAAVIYAAVVLTGNM